MQLHLLDATYELFRAHFGRPPHARRRRDGRSAPRSAWSRARSPSSARTASRTWAAPRTMSSSRGGTRATPATRRRSACRPSCWRSSSWPRTRCGRSAPVVWPMVEFEADDALGTAAARWVDDPAVERIVIMTPDKDMGQCVREDGRVVTLRPAQAAVRRRGRRARQVRRLAREHPRLPRARRRLRRRLPRHPRLGRRVDGRRAARYGHLEDIPESIVHWDVSVRGAPSLAASLRDHRAGRVPLPRAGHAPPGCAAAADNHLDELRWDGVPREPLEWLAERLDEPALRSRVPRWQQRS